MSDTSAVRGVGDVGSGSEAEEASRQAWELKSAAEAIWDGQQKARRLVDWADGLTERHGRACRCRVCRAAQHMSAQARALLVGEW